MSQNLVKLDITLVMEDGAQHLAKVRLPEQAAHDAHFGEKLTSLLANIDRARAGYTPGTDAPIPAELIEASADLPYRLCWMAWKYLHRTKKIDVDQDDFLAAIDTYGVHRVGEASPFPSAPPVNESSSSPSSPGLPPPIGVST